MFWLLLTQSGTEGGISIVEEVRGERTRFYNLEGIMGMWWGKRQYYRSEAAFQMQFDEGFYGRFSVTSFNEYAPWSFGMPTIKDLYVERAYDNGLDIRIGLGPIYWENGVLFGDYIGGNPFIDVFWGREVWIDLLVYKINNRIGAGLRGALDINGFGLTVYGVYDSSRVGYLGVSADVSQPFFTFSLEATGEKDTSSYEGAYVVYAFLKPGRWFAGLMSYSFTSGFDRLSAQGLNLDPDRSPFFGVSTPLTYNSAGIPWTYPQNTSAEVFRFGFLHTINEDWKMIPIFDAGLYQAVAMDFKKNALFADIHLVFRWVDSYYIGASAGIINGYVNDTTSTTSWGVALYSVKMFNF